MRRIFAIGIGLLSLVTFGGAPVQAQEASPAAGGACTVVPYDLTDVLASAAASPVASGAATDAVTERPTGEAADDETTVAVTQTVEQFFACINEGYLYRYIFLFTPEYLSGFLAGSVSAETNDQLLEEITNESEPTPLPSDQQTVLVGIEDIEILDDGRVIATVIGEELTSETGASPVYFILEEVDGVYLIDDVIDPVVEGGTPVA